MKRVFLLAITFLLFVSTSNVFATTLVPTSNSTTCESCEEKGDILTGELRDQYIEEAINAENVSNLLETYKTKGFKLILEDSQVGRSNEGIVGTTLVLSLETEEGFEYAYLLYNNNTGQVTELNEEILESIEKGEDVELNVCFTCIAYCLALAEVPAVFAACIAFCAGSFC